jgi:hypothetical protein
MTEGAMDPAVEGPSAGRRWWLRMLLWSAGLVIVLFGLYLGVQPARLYYYGWQYRRHPDKELLWHTAELAVATRINAATFCRLTSKPDLEGPDRLFYLVGGGGNHGINYLEGYGIDLSQGRTVGLRRLSKSWRDQEKTWAEVLAEIGRMPLPSSAPEARP